MAYSQFCRIAVCLPLLKSFFGLFQLKTEKERLLFLSNMQRHYVAAIKHILTKSALQPCLRTLARNLGVLHPDRRMEASSGTKICGVARDLPVEVEIDVLLDEWHLLQSEKGIVYNKGDRIDKYWNQFFELKTSVGEPKYPSVTRVVKAALVIGHGNARAERGFSDSGNTLTDARASMDERTLNATQTVKSALKLFGNQPTKVPITRELMSMARSACSSYQAYLQAKKAQQEEKERKKLEAAERKKEAEKLQKALLAEKETLEKDEKKLTEIKLAEKEKREVASRLLAEANERLKKATASKNMVEVQLAQGMLSGVESYRKDADDISRSIEVLQRSVDKRKASMIERMSKKPKLDV